MRRVDVVQSLVEGADDAGPDLPRRGVARWITLMNGIPSR